MTEHEAKIWDTISLGLEIIGFVLVTVDLFGKKNLERLNTFLESRLDVNGQTLKEAGFDNLNSFKREVDRVYGSALAIIAAVLTEFVVEIEGFLSSNFLFAFPIFIVVMGGIAIWKFPKYLKFITRQQHTMRRFFGDGALYALSTILHWLIKRETVEGIFVLIGAFFVISSKALSIWLCWSGPSSLHS